MTDTSQLAVPVQGPSHPVKTEPATGVAASSTLEPLTYAKVQVAPWADTLVARLRQQPAGDWFLAVAAALEYMTGLAPVPGHSGDEAGDTDSAPQKDRRPLSADDADDTDAQSRDEAAADWLTAQGFDRKE